MNHIKKTRYELAEALIRVMQIKSLKKITVKDISNECPIARQIFYRYFTSKYDLIEWTITKDWRDSICKTEYFVWEKNVLIYLKYIKAKKRFYSLAAKSDDSDFIYYVLHKHITNTYRDIIEFITEQKISSHTEFILQVFCRGGIDMLMEWFKDDMKIPTEEICQLFVDSMPYSIQSLLIYHSFPLCWLFKDKYIYNK